MATLSVMLMFIQRSIYKLTKYTTIGNHIWFGEFIDKIVDKMNHNKYSAYIIKLSYSKALTCRPCHTFWINLIILSTFGMFSGMTVEMFTWCVFWSLFLYTLNNGNDKEQK